MCGFAGVVRHRDGVFAPGRAEALLAAVRHRGPDQEGIRIRPPFLLAAARLRVQGDERGDQPLASEDGRFLLAFNGEILGPPAAALRRLAGAAAPPPAAGDTPLLLAAVGQLARAGPLDGATLATLLEGSLGAFALVDTEHETLWLVRDRLGIRPLHVRSGSEETVFASELAPLRATGPTGLDPEGLAELLTWHRPVRRLPDPGVHTVPPGAAWRITAGGRITRWAGGQGIRDLVSSDGPATGPDDLARAWQAAARAAAETDGPASVWLSGGLDSGATAAWAGREDLLALTGRFGPPGGPFDESEAAAAVAKAVGCAHEVLDLADGDLLEDLPAVVRALEVPLAGPGALALWRMARRARTHGRVVLTGTGGDELLCGYARTALVLGRAGPWTEGYEALAGRIEAAGPGTSARQRAVLDRSADLAPFLAGDLARLAPPEPPGRAARDDLPPGEALEALREQEVEGTLPALLHVEDRIAMAHGLEGRPVPCLLDVPRVAARLAPEWLVGPDGEGKRALREALRGVLPEAVRTDRTKRGFPTPFARAVRGEARSAAQAIVDDRRFVERGWWDVARVRAALDEPRPAHDRALYALLSWELWARSRDDGDAGTRWTP